MGKIGQLLIILLKAHRTTLAEKLSKLDLYPGQDGLIYHLAKHDGLTMSDLSEKLGIRLPTLFTMVDRMEATGTVRKDKDKADKRTSRIFLTSKGEKLAGALLQIWLEMEDQLAAGFTEEERAMTTEVLNKLIRNLNS